MVTMMPQNSRSWYALHVRSSQERLVTSKLQFDGLDAFYPHYLEKSRDRRREIDCKFFPGYVFVAADLARWNLGVAGIPQIVRIVGNGQSALPIDEREIEAIRIMADSPLASISAPCPFLETGNKVMITRGAFAGLEGFVVRAGRKAHVVISVQALRQSRSIEVSRDDVERAEPLRKAA